MVTILSLLFAILFSTMYMAYVGISLKEAEKSVLRGESDYYTWYVVRVKAPVLMLGAFITEVFLLMVHGIRLLFSEEYRAAVIAEDLLFEEVEEE